MKTVYTCVDAGGKRRFVKIGTALVNADGSIAIKLAAFPVNGTLEVRDNEPAEVRRG